MLGEAERLRLLNADGDTVGVFSSCYHLGAFAAAGPRICLRRQKGSGMGTGSLPEEGELQLGSVRLPAGKRILAGHEAPSPVAWVTREAMPEPGRAWAALSDSRGETGLVPFLLGNLPGDPTRPWDTEEFDQPTDPGELNQMPAVGVLAEPPPAGRSPRLTDRGADRPRSGIPAVVRSWEDRFGARLLRVGFAEINLLVDNPPRSIGHAQCIAAEHFAFCDECAGDGLSDIPGIAAGLMKTPIWTFWWD